MTQKKTMTKNEAREWLKDKYVDCNGFKEVGKVRAFFKMVGFVPNAEDLEKITLSPVTLSDLLAIEIVEEPDHRALLEEAVKLLEECCPIMHRLTPDVKARSQINKIEQFLKANRP